LDARTLELLAALLSGDWAVVEAAADATRSQASGVVAAYTQFHLERGLRSLQHVDRTAPQTSAAPKTSTTPKTTGVRT
jgi:DNA repair protein RecO (recombination protein O)